MMFKQFTTTLAFASIALAGRAFASNQAPHDFAHGIQCTDCHIPSGSQADPTLQAGGTATGGTATSLSDSSKTWTTGAFVGGVITFKSGGNLGQFRTITTNDGTSVSWLDPLPAAAASGDSYTLNLVTYDDIEVKCKACHNPTGDGGRFPSVGLHNTGVHGKAIGCGKCHEPHNIEPNSGYDLDGDPGNLIRQDIRRPDGSKGTIVYAPGVLTQPAGNGVCQTCHTKTPYYRNDGSLQTHHVGENCVSCHSHDVQFFVDLNGASDLNSGDHYDSNSQAYTDHTASGACVRCHTNGGFQDYVGATGAAMNYNDTFLAKGTVYPSGPMNCQTCHNSKSDPTVATAGLTSVEFVSLNTVGGLDKATGLCSQCHQGRESTASVNSKIAGAVVTASKGLGIVTITAGAAGTTTTIQAKTAMTASQYKGYTLVSTNNANQGLKVTVSDNTVGTTTTAGTITLATALTASTSGAITGPPAIPADTFTMWPTATGGTSDSYVAGVRQGSVLRGIDLVDSNRVWTANQWTNFYIFIQTDPNPGSPNAGLYRLITGNTATTLSVANATLTTGMPFPAPIAAGTRYQILVKEDTTVLDVVASSISFSNSHYLPASAILHGADAMIGYQNPRNLANSAVVVTGTATSTATSTSTALGTGTATGTVTITTTSTSTTTNIITPNVAAARSYSGKNLHGVSQDSCVSCHSPHTLEVKVDSTTCGRCHFKDDGTPVTSMTELEDARQFGFNGDIDGDGIEEGMKAEVDGLAAKLFGAIRSYATVKTGHGICYTAATNPYWFLNNDAADTTGACTTAEADPCNLFSAVSATTVDANSVACVAAKQHTGYYTPRLLRAVYNYQIYIKEPGAWAHNPRYIIQMMYDSLVDLNMGLTGTQQVGYVCATLDSDKQIVWSTATADDGTCAGKVRAFGPRRSFEFGTHFDGMKNAFRNWDKTVTNGGQVSYPCMRCHGGQQGLEQYLGASTWFDQTQPSAAATVPAQGQQCTTCHQPLTTDTDMKRLRNIGATPAGGVRVPGHLAGGTLVAAVPGATVVLDASNFGTPGSMICSSCHQSRDINGVLLDKYLDGTWSGIDVVGRPFSGTTSITNNGAGSILLSGLPTYVAATTTGTPNNWLYDTTKTGTAAQLALGKFITISGSANYNGTYAITACTNGTATLNKAYMADEAGVSWSAFAAATKNIHDIQAGSMVWGSAGHVGYEYSGKTYAGVAMHGTKKADCIGCHQPIKSRHSMKIDDVAKAGGCNGSSCHTGIDDTNFDFISNAARGLATGNGYDGDPTTQDLKSELQAFVKKAGTALNTYAVATVGRGFCVGIDATDSLSYRLAAAGNTTGVCTTEATNWNTAPYAYDAKMVRAIYNMSMANPGNTGAAWFMGFDYTAQLIYDSIVDLGGSTAGLTRP
jgi:hypothetical protein